MATAIVQVFEASTKGMVVEITPEWVAVVLTALTMGGGAGVWVERRLAQARQSLPIIRAEWTRHPESSEVKLTLVNRLDEDLLIQRAECSGRLIGYEYGADSGGSFIGSKRSGKGASVALDWRIRAKSTGWEFFVVEGPASPRWLRITISSSAKTLRCKQVTIRDSQRP